MRYIHGTDIDDLYKSAISLVLNEGMRFSPRGKPTREVLSPVLCLSPQIGIPVIRNSKRKLNYAFFVVEAIQYLDGCMDVERICAYNKNLREFVNPVTGEFDGSYGPRIGDQLDWCLKELGSDPHSRRAVVSIFKCGDIHSDKDVPCTVSIQFLIRDRGLDCIVNMRSNDLDWGTPYDMMSFCFLQHALSSWLGVRPGRYIHHAGSLHIYETSVEKLEMVLSCNEKNAVDIGWFEGGREETKATVDQFWNLEGINRRTGMRCTMPPSRVPFCRMLDLVNDHLGRKK